MHSLYKARGTRRNNMLFAWQQKPRSSLWLLCQLMREAVRTGEKSPFQQRPNPEWWRYAFRRNFVEKVPGQSNLNPNKRIWKNLEVNGIRPLWSPLLLWLPCRPILEHIQDTWIWSKNLPLLYNIWSNFLIEKGPLTFFFHVWNETEVQWNLLSWINILDKKGSFTLVKPVKILCFDILQ